MESNINTVVYWESRFSTGDWEDKGGRAQTFAFAEAQVPHFQAPLDFRGRLVDFGCGLGDAMPVYRNRYPHAKLVGIDISRAAIEASQKTYGRLAEFICGTHEAVPNADVIVASNVLEHLTDDLGVANELLGKCRQLYITVPYLESPLCAEHLRAYDEDHFRILGEYDCIIFPSKGWSEYGLGLFRLRVKSLLRQLSGNVPSKRRQQIMFRFRGRLS